MIVIQLAEVDFRPVFHLTLGRRGRVPEPEVVGRCGGCGTQTLMLLESLRGKTVIPFRKDVFLPRQINADFRSIRKTNDTNNYRKPRNPTRLLLHTSTKSGLTRNLYLSAGPLGICLVRLQYFNICH